MGPSIRDTYFVSETEGAWGSSDPAVIPRNLAQILKNANSASAALDFKRS
jgi:hypothetical protein